MKIGKVIFDKLSNDSTLNSLGYSTNIYPTMAQQGVDFPYITYSVVDDDPIMSKSTSAGSLADIDEKKIEINIFSESYSNIVDASVAIIKSLNRFKGTNNSVVVDSINYDDTNDNFDQTRAVYIRTLDFITRVKN